MTTGDPRSSQRLRAAIPCLIRWEERSLTGLVSNLSHGGAFISTNEGKPPPGTPLLVELQAGDETIPFPARVRDSEADQPDASFGIQFLGSPEEVEASMIRLVDALFAGADDDPAND